MEARMPAGATAVLFGAATLTTMVLLVGLAHAGTCRAHWEVLERWPHSAAGAILALSGVAMLVGS
jgi:hypothetical protein